jgi:quercetin dioxygenase-like cupin family protein
MESAMPLISAMDAPQFTIPGVTFTGLASPSRGSSQTAVWTVSLAPGTMGDTHQLTDEEIFICLEGSADVQLGVETLTIAPGDTLIVPACTDFALRNRLDIPFKAIAVFPVGGKAVLPGKPAFTPPWAA